MDAQGNGGWIKSARGMDVTGLKPEDATIGKSGEYQLKSRPCTITGIMLRKTTLF